MQCLSFMRIFTSILFLLFSISLFSQDVSTLTGNISASGGVTLDEAGNVYIADFGVALNNSNGTEVLKLDPSSGNLSVFARNLSGASGNDFDSKGNLFQSNIGANRISKISRTGVVTNFTSVGIVAPVGITIDEGDTLFVCNCGNHTLRKVWPTGQSLPFSASPLLRCPNGITSDPQGNLYVSNFDNGDVIKVTPSGQASRLATVPGNRNGHVTWSPEGHLIVASHGSHAIYKVTLSGDVTRIAGTQVRGIDDGPALQATFSAPNGIAVTSTGDTAFVNCTLPHVIYPPGLNPSVLRMITGLRTPNAIGDLDDNLELKIGPNPAQDHLYVSMKLDRRLDVEVRLYSWDGKEIQVWLKEVQPGQHPRWEFQLPPLASGMYQLSILGDTFSATRKLQIK